MVRALGAARLVPVPYVTESARVHALLPVEATAEDAKAAKAFLRRWDALCLQRNANAALTIVRPRPRRRPRRGRGADGGLCPAGAPAGRGGG